MMFARKVVEEGPQAHIRRLGNEPGKSQALTRSLFTAFISNDQVRGLTRDTMTFGRARIAEIIATGQRRGEIRRDREADALALAFQRSVLGTLLLWAMQPNGDLHAWLDATFRDYWAAAETRANLKGAEYASPPSQKLSKSQRTRTKP